MHRISKNLFQYRRFLSWGSNTFFSDTLRSSGNTAQVVTPVFSDLPNVFSPSELFFIPCLNDFDALFLPRPGRGIGRESKLNLNFFIPLELDGIEQFESRSSNLHYPLYVRFKEAYVKNLALICTHLTLHITQWLFIKMEYNIARLIRKWIAYVHVSGKKCIQILLKFLLIQHFEIWHYHNEYFTLKHKWNSKINVLLYSIPYELLLLASNILWLVTRIKHFEEIT